MNAIRKSFLLALTGSLACASAYGAASEPVVVTVEEAVVHAAKVAASGVERGAKAAAHGVEVGTHAAASGVRRGAKAVAHGVEAGASATARAAKSVETKVGAPASAGGK